MIRFACATGEALTSLLPQSCTYIPESHMLKYIQQVLGVILTLLEDPNEAVQLTAVQCLLTVSMNTKMRINAFAAYGVGLQRTAFIEGDTCHPSPSDPPSSR